MSKGTTRAAVLFLLVSFTAAQAQQFDVVPVGPQVQDPYQARESRQQPGGLTQTAPQAPEVRKPPSEAIQPEHQVKQPEGGPAEAGAQPLSAFEAYTQQKTREAVERPPGVFDGEPTAKRLGRRSDGQSIRQFGYNLFSRLPSTFAPIDRVPVGPDYVIGPDDEIRIEVWGKVDGQWTVRVNRDGNISVPKIGVLGVTGLTFEEVKDLLRREFSKYFTGFDMNVSMGSLRTIRVYIVGNAMRPGAYTVSSLTTLVNGLIEAGGPSKTGSMRDIQVKRNGRTVVHFDLYDLLLKGDKTKDARLMPEDVIFIPPIGPMAAMVGNVKNPAIYELRDETRLAEMIGMAGGLTGFAFKGRVQIRRTEGQEFRTVFERDLVDIEKDDEKNLPLRDWDIVTVFNVAENPNIARVTGAVASPGEFGIVPGVTTVSDVITKAGRLLYYASHDAEITRVKVTQSGPVTERFTVNVAKALAGDPRENAVLQMNDYIFVRAVPDWQLYRTVTISGEVSYPGTYTIKRGERLSSLIERAGGFTEYAYLRGAVFTRERVRELQQRNLEEMIARMERELLAQSATITSTSPESAETRKTELQQKQAFIESLKKARANGRLTVRLARVDLLKGSSYDIELESGDVLCIPMNNKVVNVVGAVMSNASLVYVDDASPKDYVQMAGGYSRYADRGHMYVLKVDGSARELSGGGIFNWNDSRDHVKSPGFGGEVKQLEAGDTIVVPEKLERIAWLREIKDITIVLAQLATAAGIIYLIR